MCFPSHSMNVSLCICINIIRWGRQSEVIFCWLGLLQINHQRIFFFCLHLHKHEALWGELHIKWEVTQITEATFSNLEQRLSRTCDFQCLSLLNFHFQYFIQPFSWIIYSVSFLLVFLVRATSLWNYSFTVMHFRLAQSSISTAGQVGRQGLLCSGLSIS